jgi:copper chaperone
MKSINFKTNINCESCVRSITPFLNEIENINTWEVDTDHHDKLLKVSLNNDNEELVIEAVKKAGFEIQKFLVAKKVVF